MADQDGGAEAELRALLEPVVSGFRPNQVLAVTTDPVAAEVPLVRDRSMLGGAPTAYLCRGFTCRMPVTDAAALRAQLEEPAGVA